MATVRALVVLGGAPATADELADVLRDAFTVRTAYSTEEVLDRLDPAVDVVLVGQDLSVGTVRETVTERGLDCQVGLVARTGEDSRVDTVVSPDAPDGTIREEVQRLATRARYRKTLEEYYDLSRTAAELRSGDGDVRDELDTLQRRLDRLRRRLDEAADPIDTATLFETVFDPDREE
jgi:uncharacterized NAD(P)/FAD-binding protein YdhS